MEGDNAGEILCACFGEGADEDLGDGDEEGGEATGVVEGADAGGVVGFDGGGVVGVDGGGLVGVDGGGVVGVDGDGLFGIDGGGVVGVAVGGVAGLVGGGGEALGRVLISSFIPPTLQCPPVPQMKYLLPTEARVITVMPPV